MLSAKKQIVKLLWKHSYGAWRNGELGEFAEQFDEYPDYLAQVLLDHFIIEKRDIILRKKKK